MSSNRVRRVLTLLVVACGVLTLWTYGPPLLVQFVTFLHSVGPRGQAVLLLYVLTFMWVRRGVAYATRDRRQVQHIGQHEHLPGVTGARLDTAGDAVPWLESAIAPRKRRARHEAAHVVAGRAMGGILQHADVDHDPVTGRGGQVIMLWPSQMPVSERSWGMAVMAVAANELDVSEGSRDGSSLVDLQTAHTAALMIVSSGQTPPGYKGPLTVEGLLAAAREQARGILQERIAEVDRIAEQLEAAGEGIPSR